MVLAVSPCSNNTVLVICSASSPTWEEKCIHLRKLIATLVRENAVCAKLEERIGVLESRLNEIKKQPNTDVSMMNLYELPHMRN